MERVFFSHRLTFMNHLSESPIMRMSIMRNSALSKELNVSKTGTEPMSNKVPLFKILTKLKEFTKVKNNKKKNNI